MKRVSVCIATYNGSKYIHRQLLSIIPQLNKNDEIVISDDNSTDETLLEVGKVQDSRIKVIINEGKNGPVFNFENALKNATGKYIFLSDQDDIWESGRVENLLKILQVYDLVLTDCYVVDNNLNIVHDSFFNVRNSKRGFWRNLLKNSYVGCCMAFRVDILTYALPFPQKIHMHDWWIGLLVELKGKVFFLNEQTIKYVRHGENFSPTGERGYNIYERLRNRAYMFINILNRLLTN